MAPFPDMLEEDDEDLLGAPTPVGTIAGPQTPRAKVMDRISKVRTSSGDDDEMGAAPTGDRDAAIQFARNAAGTASMGRALNAFAAGTGYKPDNSGNDATEKFQTDFAMKDLDRSARVKQAVEARKGREAQANASLQARADALAANQQAQKDRNDAYNKRTNVMGSLASSRQDNANIRAADKIMGDKNAQKEVNKLQASRAAQSLVDGIRSGDIKDSKNVARQLTNMIATIEMGAPGGQGDRNAMGVDTLYGRLKGALGYVEGKPEGVIPDDYLNQLESETHALGDRAAANYRNITEGSLNGADLSGGDPEANHGKVYALGKQRRDSLLKSNGYDPDTGMPLSRRKGPGGVNAGTGDLIPSAMAAGKTTFDADDLSALQWAKANPTDKKALQIMDKLKGKGLH